MQTISDYIFEQKLNEWLNNESDILVERYVGYRRNRGFWGWLRKIGKKFWGWLNNKTYDPDTDWYYDKKTKPISLDHDKYRRFIKSNPELAKKFPGAYEMSKKKGDSTHAVTTMNASKAFPSIIMFDDEIESIVEFIKEKTDKKMANQTKEWLDQNFNDGRSTCVLNVEFAEEQDYSKVKQNVYNSIYSELNKEYTDVFMFIYSDELQQIFSDFIKNNKCELKLDKTNAIIKVDINDLKSSKK